jgi:hypothetical protein
VLAASVLVFGPTDAHAQTKITRLGSPSTRFTAPIRDTAALQKTFATRRNQTAISQVLDKAGLTSLTPRVLAALTEGKVTETSVAPGTTIQWMALRRGGRPDVVTNAVWAGRQAFDGYAFTIEDGVKIYNFVVPKACGNLALVSVSEKPLPECVQISTNRECERKQVTFTASGTAITDKQATKVTVLRNGTPVGDMLPEGGFRITLPVQPGRYTFTVTDPYGRQYGTCERDVNVEECRETPAPQPTPPPAPTSCGALLTAEKVRGGYNFRIDGSQSASGASPAARATLQLIGPDGQPASFTYNGATQTEVEFTPPFQGTFFVANAKPGTYTVRARATASDPKAEARTCESTIVVPEETDNIDWFVDGAFGKLRRQYDLQAAAPSTATITPGFCDPMLGIKGGPVFWFAEQRASFAPAAGVAFMFGDLGDYDYGDNEYNNVAVMLEAVVNYHFQPRGAYVGSGLGWWDVFDGDHNTGAWIVNFGVPVKTTDRGDSLFFIGEGRLFFDAPDGVDNNYQLWGGLRYVRK